MEAKFYFNKSDKRYVRKDIELINTFSVEFLENSSIIDPVLKLHVTSQAMNANYLWLHDFHRYYYINDITVSQGYMYVQCHVDVLMTYALEIKEIECIIRRQEDYTKCNAYQNDDRWKLNAYPCTRTLSFDPDDEYGFKMAVTEFIMGVIGDVS